jgi:FkbM family methyltransferase
MIKDSLRILELPSGLRFWIREGTNDHNTIWACAHEDEYGLGAVEVDGKLVLDVGAYLGGIGVWLAARGAEVVCLEPVPDNAELIRRNAELNGVNVTILQAAAGETGTQVVRWGFLADPTWNERVAADPTLGWLHTEEIRACIEHHGFVGVTHKDAPVDQTFRELEVTSLSLSDVIADHGSPHVIKLDCEGGEWPWLADPAMRDVELVVGEWHPWSNTEGTAGVGGFRGNRGREVAIGRGLITELLGATHSLEFSGPTGGPGGFRATRR